MRIGIDIDDTITESWKYLMPIYSKEFNVRIDEKTEPYYNAVKEVATFDEYIEVNRKIENIKKEVPLKKNVAIILKKLKKEGHMIIFITARGRAYNDPYKFTKEYLDKYNVPYDKIIVDSWDKATTCQKEHIDLFIDDRPKHCEEVLKCGIDVLMMQTKYNEAYVEFKQVKNWNEIYKYINKQVIK